MQSLRIAAPVLFATALLMSCQSGPAPTSPATNESSSTLPASAVLPPDLGVLGALTLTLDPTTLAGVAEPLRTPAAYGDNYWLNATGFLDGAPCKDCFGIDSIARDGDGHVVLRVRARHPFPAGNPGLPISGSNRLDLHVFDANVLIAGDLDTTNGAFTGGSTQLPVRLVRNAAGYSGLLQPVVADVQPTLSATAYPYVMLNPDPTAGSFAPGNPSGFADPTQPSGYNVFPMGADVTADVVLGVTASGGPLSLQLYFACAYGASVSGRAERLTPRYALPEFNSKAPWRVELDIPVATNALMEGDPGSSMTVNARVWDWQQGGTIDPGLASLDAIRGTSDVTGVELVLPGFRSGVIDLGSPLSGTGPFDDPLTYSAQVFNTENAPAGDYVALLAATDSRTPGLNAGGATDALSSQTGATIDPVAITRFVTYQSATFSVAAPPSRQLLSIDLSPDTRQIIDQGAGSAITFTAIGTFDQPPLTEDISATAVFSSTAVDVMSFVANTGTGIGMGRTSVTCEQDGVTSDACEVIVKPALITTMAFTNPAHIDVHHGTNEVFISRGTDRTVHVYNDQGIFQRSWSVAGQIGVAIRGLTVNPVLNRVTVSADGNQAGIDTATYDLFGVNVSAGSRDFLSQNAIDYLEDGTFWGADFGGTPFRMTNYNPDNGVIISGFNHAFLSASYDMEAVGTNLYVSTPGGRTVGRAWTIINPLTQTIIGTGASSPPGSSQNTTITVDRDGFIHLGWGFSPSPLVPYQVYVYEFVAPATVNVLYSYNFGAFFDVSSLGCNRNSNNIILGASFPTSSLTFLN